MELFWEGLIPDILRIQKYKASQTKTLKAILILKSKINVYSCITFFRLSDLKFSTKHMFWKTIIFTNLVKMSKICIQLPKFKCKLFSIYVLIT